MPDRDGVLITLRRDMVTYVDEMTDRRVDRALIAEGVLKRLAAIEAEARERAIAEVVVPNAVSLTEAYERGRAEQAAEVERLRAVLPDIMEQRCQAAVWHDIPDRWLVCMDYEYNEDEPTQPCPPCTARAALAATPEPRP